MICRLPDSRRHQIWAIAHGRQKTCHNASNAMELAGQQRRVELTILYLFSYYRRFTRNSCSLHKEKTGYCVNTFMHAIETALPFRTKNVCGVIELRQRRFQSVGGVFV
jgi:hypothetical protein